MAKILCVGQIVADILVRSVDKIDFSIDTKRVDQIVIKNGGDCLNTAIDLKKLGADVGFCGVLGKDALGKYLQNVLRENGIDDSAIYYDSEANTSSTVALINSEGDRIFLYYGGTNDILSVDKLKMNSLDEASIVHVGGTFLLPKLDGEGTRELFEEAHKRGCLTTMDVTYDTTEKWLDIILPCLKELDLFIPSLNEAKRICGTDVPKEIACFLKEKGVKNVILKLGKKGCYVDAFGKSYYQEAFTVPVVDTTGAGDAFVSGILYGITRGWKIEKTTQFASAVSAQCIQKLGATAGVVSSDKTLEFIEKKMKEVQ